MKRANQLLERIAEPENLRLAFWKARKGKSYAKTVAAYRMNLEINLARLREQILSGKVQVGQYHFFKIFDPKERQICAPAFSEQVLHHALMNICHPYFERVQVFNSYACRKGKGTYAALERAKVFSKKYDWFLKLDVRKFFESIHHEVLKRQLACMFKDYRLLDIFSKIIDSYSAWPERGLPIGNLTSQYFANHYLSGLDHFIKEQLRVPACVRYMDDLVLWTDDKAQLTMARSAIREYVQEDLQGVLKPELLNRTTRGLPFLGYLIRPFSMRLTQRSKQRFIKKIGAIDQQYQSGAWSEADSQRHVLPLLAFTQHADAREFRKSVLSKMNLIGQSS